MKYESTILKRLIDTYGVTGNPRYISEIIKEFIVRGKECFPNLFTYQADWLAHIDEFGLNPSYTVSYTGQSIYAPNTLESPVKSAILKGQTLVNLINGGEVTENATNNWVVFSADFNADMIKTSTDYTLITYVISNTLSDGSGCDFGVSGGLNDGFGFKAIRVPSGKVGVYKIKLTTKNVFSQPPALRQQIFDDVATGSITFKQVLVEGDYTNIDIPYFEGMQSVKLPVLTTTGKNLAEQLLPLNSNGGSETTTTVVDSSSTIATLIEVGGNITLTVSKENVGSRFRYFMYRENPVKGVTMSIGGEYVDNRNTVTFTTQPDTKYLLVVWCGDKNIDYPINPQIEYGNQVTPYEPYKSNILTVNEDVTLRGIEDVQDELNLLTGEVTERIGEIVLDGSEDWILGSGFSSNENGNFECKNINVGNRYKKVVSTHFNYDSGTDDRERVRATNSNYIVIYINKTRLESPTVDGFKNWLITQKNSGNPVKVQYQLLEKSIKTVDLTILDQNGQNVQQLMSFNGGTHFSTASSEGSPLPTVSVSVETDLEETLMMCSLEGNTL